MDAHFPIYIFVFSSGLSADDFIVAIVTFSVKRLHSIVVNFG